MNLLAFGQADLGKVLRASQRRFLLDLHGIHGVAYWQRVRENGLRLARVIGADPLLVEMCAFLHDCCREDDQSDPEHGDRAALFAASLQGSLLNLERQDLDQLCQAIRDHRRVLTRGPVTLLACWDADRLDLVRVGIRPQTHLLCTEAARNNRILEWAYGRSLLSTGVAVPPFPWWVTVEGMLGLLPPSHLEEGRYRQELSCTGLADFLTGRPGWARLALSGF